MRELFLGGKYGSSEGRQAIVSIKDFDLQNKFRWHCVFKGGKFYAARRKKIGEKSCIVYLHRELLEMKRGNKRHVDHIDGDGLNNSRDNLRVCLPSQNAFNRSFQKNNKFGLKGVSFESYTNRFKAQISAYGKRINLGRFDTPEEAHAAYREAQSKLHGEYARI